jgi:8-oxo-dGTP diphosphatase
MRFGISAAGLVLRQGRLLLVRHYRAGEFDFWLPPGGALEGEESIPECAEREVREETGLLVRAGPILYVQEFVQPGFHFCKFFLLCEEVGGSLSLVNREPEEVEFLEEARFVGRDEVAALDLRPPALREEVWEDMAAGAGTRYLGLQVVDEPPPPGRLRD